MSEELKPCPFCGGKAVIEVIELHRHIICKMPVYKGGAFIECTECGCAISGETETEATEKWNRRLNDPEKVVKQLEDMKSTYRRLRDLKDKDYLKYGYIIETLIDAIEIVKDDGGDEMIEKSMPATKNVPKERDTMSCKKAERYGYVKAICETDKGLFNRKVEEWINLTDGVILDASCGIIDGKTVFQAVIGGLRK